MSIHAPRDTVTAFFGCYFVFKLGVKCLNESNKVFSQIVSSLFLISVCSIKKGTIHDYVYSLFQILVCVRKYKMFSPFIQVNQIIGEDVLYPRQITETTYAITCRLLINITMVTYGT